MEVSDFLQGLGGASPPPTPLPPASTMLASLPSSLEDLESKVLSDIVAATRLLQGPSSSSSQQGEYPLLGFLASVNGWGSLLDPVPTLPLTHATRHASPTTLHATNGSHANTVGDPAAFTTATTTTTSAPASNTSGTSQISDARRKEILAQLASERAERRGFSSERETTLAAGNPAPGGEEGGGVAAAVHRVTSQAVSSAIQKAFGSVGLAVPVAAGAGASAAAAAAASSSSSSSTAAFLSAPSASNPPTLSQSSFLLSSYTGATAGGRGRGGGGTGDPLLYGGTHTTYGMPLEATTTTTTTGSSTTRGGHSRAERDDLVSRLLAERRAKVLGSGASETGTGAGSAAGVVKATPAFSAAVQATLSGGSTSTSSTSYSGPGRPYGSSSSLQQQQQQQRGDVMYSSSSSSSSMRGGGSGMDDTFLSSSFAPSSSSSASYGGGGGGGLYGASSAPVLPPPPPSIAAALAARAVAKATSSSTTTTTTTASTTTNSSNSGGGGGAATYSSAPAPNPPPTAFSSSSSSTTALLDTLEQTHGADNAGILRALRSQVAERLGIQQQQQQQGAGRGASSSRVTFALSPSSPTAAPPTPYSRQSATTTAGNGGGGSIVAPAAVAPPPPALASSSAATTTSTALESSSSSGSGTGTGNSRVGAKSHSPTVRVAFGRSTSVTTTGSSSTFSPGVKQPQPQQQQQQQPQQPQQPQPVAHIARINALAKDKSRLYAAWERTKAAEVEEELAASCPFQPFVAEDMESGGGGGEGGGRRSRSGSRSRSRGRGVGGGHAEGGNGSGFATNYATSFAREYLGEAGAAGINAHHHHTPTLGITVDASAAITGTAPTPVAAAASSAGARGGERGRTGKKSGGGSSTTATTVAPPPPPPPTHSSSSSGSSDVVKRLYAEADKRALKLAQAKAAVERAASSAYTFTPSINPLSRLMVEERGDRDTGGVVGGGFTGASGVNGGGGGGGGAAHTQHLPLHLRTEEVLRHSAHTLHKLRMEAAAGGVAGQCTFQPKINPTSAHLASKKQQQQQQQGSGGVDIYPNQGRSGAGGGGGGGGASSPPPSIASTTERLARGGVEREAKLAGLRAAAAKEAARQFTFAPRIDTQATDMHLKARLSRLEGAAGGSGGGGGGEEGEGGPSPSDPSASASASASAQGPGPAADPHSRFLTRQATLAAASATERAAREAAIVAAGGCTFRPDIGNAEEVLALLRPGRVVEGVGATVARLAVEGAGPAKAAAAAAAAEAAVVATHPFKPTLNARSRALGRGHTLEELNANEHGGRVKLRAAAIAEAEFQALHTFKPSLVGGIPAAGGPGGLTINAVHSPPTLVPVAGKLGASDPVGLSARVAEVREAVEAKREAARRRAEYEELAPCTFAPSIAPSQASLAKLKEAAAVDGGVVVVRGLGRHLELKELSRHLEEEKRERETAAFAIKMHPWGEGRLPTIPQPFHFSTEARSGVPQPPLDYASSIANDPVAQRALLKRLIEGEVEMHQQQQQPQQHLQHQPPPPPPPRGVTFHQDAASPNNLTQAWGEGNAVDITRM